LANWLANLYWAKDQELIKYELVKRTNSLNYNPLKYEFVKLVRWVQSGGLVGSGQVRLHQIIILRVCNSTSSFVLRVHNSMSSFVLQVRNSTSSVRWVQIRRLLIASMDPYTCIIKLLNDCDSNYHFPKAPFKCDFSWSFPPTLFHYYNSSGLGM